MNDPSLVLMPGLDGTGLLFQPLLRELPESLPVSVVTYPGNQPLDYERLLPLAMAALPSPAPFVLLGESFSGPLALRVAARRPAGLRGVILGASFFKSPHPYLPQHLPLLKPALLRLAPRFSQVKALLGCYATPELAQLVRHAMTRVTAETLAARLRAALAVDATDELLRCPVPMMYVRASRDVVVPFWNATALRRLVPACEIHVINSSHMVLQSRPQQAAAAIMAFIRRHAPGHPNPPQAP